MPVRMPRMRSGRVRFGGAAAVAVFLSGCQLNSADPNLANGKQKFGESCAACHTLARASATGVSGPNLEAAFARSRQDGLRPSTFEGIVHQQILHPSRNPQLDPQVKGKFTPGMPAGLVSGDDARDVAAYVAQSAGARGGDTGKLAAVGAKPKGTAKAANGTLDIPVASGGLAYKFAAAEAPAGSVKITSENPQPVGHNIAVEGNGVNQKGQVVQAGGTSQITVDLKPGEYTFFCS